MKAYILIILFAGLFGILSEISFKKGYKKLGIFNLIVSLFSLCFLAGVRDLTVGTDIYYYFYQIFYDFTHTEIGILAEFANTGVDIGFILLIYIGKIFNNVNISMFIVEFAVLAPIYIFAYRNRKKYSITFIILIYCLTMYVRSFNLMRQSIAISLLILSMDYFKDRNIKKSLICFILAVLMHKTAIIGLIIYVIIYIRNTKGEIKLKNIIMIYIIFILSILILEPFLVLTGSKYIRYLNSSIENNTFSILRLLKKMIWIFIAGISYYISRRQKNEEIKNELFVAFNIFVIDFLIALIAIKAPGLRKSYILFYNICIYINMYQFSKAI